MRASRGGNTKWTGAPRDLGLGIYLYSRAQLLTPAPCARRRVAPLRVFNFTRLLQRVTLVCVCVCVCVCVSYTIIFGADILFYYVNVIASAYIRARMSCTFLYSSRWLIQLLLTFVNRVFLILFGYCLVSHFMAVYLSELYFYVTFFLS